MTLAEMVASLPPQRPLDDKDLMRIADLITAEADRRQACYDLVRKNAVPETMAKLDAEVAELRALHDRVETAYTLAWTDAGFTVRRRKEKSDGS